jgi:hypothetical protein
VEITNDLPFVPCSLKLACLVFSLLILAVDGDFYAKIVFKMEKTKVFCSFLDQVALNIHPIPPAISPPPLKDTCQSIQLYIMTQSTAAGESMVCFRKSKSILNFSCASFEFDYILFLLPSARCFSHIAYNSYLLIIPIELCGRFWQITLEPEDEISNTHQRQYVI